MPDDFSIESYRGDYQVIFDRGLLEHPNRLVGKETHVLVDARVAHLYSKELGNFIHSPTTIIIDATEENKSIDRIVDVINKIIENNIRRSHVLLAIGGGIIQDITCFIASVLLRGLEWRFVPTTLLAQADSCIGSKSSVNMGKLKNILGTFHPPKRIHVCTQFLQTLSKTDICSGLGEIIKVHAIDSMDSFDRLARDYGLLTDVNPLLESYIYKALLIKKKYIEVDEFDRGIRNIFNYGHSFGHAIESATEFSIPHGVAVSMGMQVSNKISLLRGSLSQPSYDRMSFVLLENYKDFCHINIRPERMINALSKDKKNTTDNIVVIMPVGERSEIQRVEIPNDQTFRQQCEIALQGLCK